MLPNRLLALFNVVTEAMKPFLDTRPFEIDDLLLRENNQSFMYRRVSVKNSKETCVMIRVGVNEGSVTLKINRALADSHYFASMTLTLLPEDGFVSRQDRRMTLVQAENEIKLFLK